MPMFERGVRLLLLDDAARPQQWVGLWARAYPEVWYDSGDDNADVVIRLQQAVAQSSGGLALVAQGRAVAAVSAWWRGADWRTQRRVKAIVFHAPADYSDCLHKVRFSCRTAWVCRAEAAEVWRSDAEAAGARVLIPAPADAPQTQGQWHWGMQLLAEMLD